MAAKPYANPYAAGVALGLVLGLLVGSFINVLAWRLPKMLEQDWQAQARELLDLPAPAKGPVYNLMLPRSHCPPTKTPRTVMISGSINVVRLSTTLSTSFS